MEDEQIAACFFSEEETGIPALRDHAYKIGEAETIASAEAHTNKLKSLLTSLDLWSSGSDSAMITDDEAESQSQKHQEIVDDLTKGLLDITKSTIVEMENEITTKILDILSQAAKAGSEEAVLIALKWGAPRKSEEPGLAWGTYRATVRREGRFANSKKEHNFNENLAKPFMRKIDPKWNHVFNKTIYQILNNGIAQCKTKVDVFETAFSDIMTTKGTAITIKAIFDDQLDRFVKSLDGVLQDVKKNIKAEQTTANRLCEEIIQSEMSEVYEECKEERGTGCYTRMKNTMKTHLEENAEEMFKQVRVHMRSNLRKMMKSVKKTALRELETSCEAFNRDCGYLISRKGREFSGLEQGIQSEILEVLDDAKTVFDAATKLDTASVAQGEQSLPVRSATPAAAPAVATAEPVQTFTATD
ncbi:hypothetical protein OHC33_001552 [Knufia fluminis]|uniref:DUF7605 domain-containing protein n=1 Tax=Knufia fluminis TaxID=191047 RepID=A0AAN8EZG3_9EURO|nr:hypothetical protein OHC33_001552 [Knufia fluminis]